MKRILRIENLKKIQEINFENLINEFWFDSNSYGFLKNKFPEKLTDLFKNSYLNEKCLLVDFIKNYFNCDIQIDKVLKGISSYFNDEDKKFVKQDFRPDFIIDNKLIVECDGPIHYTSGLNCFKDKIKNRIYKELNYDLIRIPYFVQLNQKIINKLFRNIKQINMYSDFPIGFIDEKAILPQDFCLLGLERFKKEIVELDIKNEIEQSLTNRKDCIQILF